MISTLHSQKDSTNWTAVRFKHTHYVVDGGPKIMKWCMDHPSDGGFSFQYTDFVYRFEREEDALHFKLVWG